MSAGSPVSVIIPTRNRAHVLPRAIDSVLGQSSPPAEVIVVDDGSTDETSALHKRFAQCRWIVQENRGVAAARNRGVAAASQPWLAFLDSDDAWLPAKLQTQLSLALELEADAVHAKEIWVRRERRVNPRSVHQLYSGWFFPYALPRCLISPSGLLIKRTRFDELGGFDPSYPAVEDYALWLKLTASHPVLLPDAPLVVKYGGHPDQLSRQVPALDRYRLRAVLDWIDSQQGSLAQRWLAWLQAKQFAQVLAAGAQKHQPQHVSGYQAIVTRALQEASAIARSLPTLHSQ